MDSSLNFSQKTAKAMMVYNTSACNMLSERRIKCIQYIIYKVCKYQKKVYKMVLL